MRTILGTSIGLFFLSLATPSFSQSIHYWSRGFGSTGSDVGNAAAMDASGNIVVTGPFTGSVDFGGGVLNDVGGTDIFVAKYTAAGSHVWSKRFGGPANDVGEAVAVDGSGNVVIAGSFDGTVDFGGGNLVSAGGNDIFVAKFNASGVHQWSYRFGSTGSDVALAIATDGSGNVIVTGYFVGTVDFGGGNLVSVGSNDIFVAKFNASGAHQWSKRFGSAGGSLGGGVAADGQGNVVITGYFSGTVDFGGGDPLVAGDNDIFIAKYDAGGTHLWSQRFGGTGGDFAMAIAANSAGNIAVTGFFQNTVDFGGGNLVSAGGNDAFVASYDANGTHLWSRRFGDTLPDVGNGVAINGAGDVVVTGFFQGSTDFGAGTVTSAGQNDIFIAKYHADGAYQWSGRFGGTGVDWGIGVALSGAGDALATGYFQGSVDFGGGSLVSAGGNDIFIAKFGGIAPEPLISSITDIGNDQGRKVKIRFARSGLDGAGAPTPIIRYEAYRRDDPTPATSTPAWVANPARGLFTDGWTEVGSVSAHGEASYGIDVPTVGDSTIALGDYYSVFFIRAATSVPTTFWDSPIDSGYSVDNLAPAIPSGFVSVAGQLEWNKSNDDDFDFFTVYGSNTSSFGAATLVDYTTGTQLDVTGTGYAYYFVTATDFSGNESKPAVLNALSGIGSTPGSYTLSISSYPNPFNPATSVRYTLPAHGRVVIAIYDLRGARVAMLVDRNMEAGAYTVEWSGRDDRGTPVGSGVYFAQLTSPAGTRSYKMTLLK